jgi:glycosyltransferase involved in cell wall biosynthesis
MRICFIALGNFTHIGLYLDYFKEAGHDVHFIALSPGPERTVAVHNVGLGRKYSAREGKWKYPISMLRARRLIKELKPDIVHAHYATSAGLTALICGFHPTIITAHGSDLTVGIKSRIWRPLLKRIFKFADCVNPVSKDLQDMVLSLGINPNKIETLTPGIDTDKFSFAEKNDIASSEVLKLVCTRRLEPVFDHQTIIRALVLLKKKQFRFEMTFVGDGSLYKELKQQVKDADIDTNVNFTGRVDNDNLPEILSRNDVYLSASLWDGASLSLLEAMAVGLFPIVSDIKANSSWIEDNVDGLLHKVGDADDLTDKILQLRDRPQLVTKAIKANRKKVVESGNRKTNLKQLERIYEKLTGKTQVQHEQKNNHTHCIAVR